MTRLVVCTLFLLAGLAPVLLPACTQRDARPEASRAGPPQAEPETPPAEAAPRLRTVELGYFNEMIEQFAAAETLVLRMEAHPQGFQLVRREFKLKRPGRFRAIHDFDGRGGERICDGKSLWMISRTRREYVEMPVIPERAPRLDLLPDLFQRAREIAAGEDEYAQLLAAAQHIKTETIDKEACDVVGIKLDRPPGTEATIWLTQAEGRPRRVRMVSPNGVIDYEVRTFEIGAELDDAVFTFTPGPDWTGRAIPLPPPATRQPTGERHSEDEPAEPSDSEKPADNTTDDQ